jgi:hypothetical protein
MVIYDRQLTTYEISVLANKTTWSTLADKNYNDLTDNEKKILSSYYLMAVDTSVRNEMTQLKKLRTSLSDSMKGIKQLMVMEEMSKPKKTNILLRGQYDQPGTEVFPNTPTDILPYPASLPRNRLGLAKWLTHEDHPLTSRVAVNRIWQQFFGMGLVKSSEDFGNQGNLPSNPQLLDWLAVEFRESGWDLKKLIRLIVTSETYKQDSYASPALRELDPENSLLARGPSGRLTAEMMRDNALAASSPRDCGRSTAHHIRPIVRMPCTGAVYTSYQKERYHILPWPPLTRLKEAPAFPADKKRTRPYRLSYCSTIRLSWKQQK